jgi:hypothetical protein
MSEEMVLPTTSEELETRLLNTRADGHLRKIRTLAHTLEALVEDFTKVKRKMMNDGSLDSDVMNGLREDILPIRRVDETKEIMSLLQAVVDVVETNVEVVDETIKSGDKKTGKIVKGRDILSVYSVVGNLE